MGSLPLQRLTDRQIVEAYQDGKSQAWCGLKARLSTTRVREILVAHGVRLRGQQEALRLALRQRPWDSTQRMHKRRGHAPSAPL